MLSKLLFTLTIITPVSVFAQSAPTSTNNVTIRNSILDAIPSSSVYTSNYSPYSGNDDLSKAMKICVGHVKRPDLVENDMMDWPQEWNACYGVHYKWEQSKEAAKAKKEKEQIEADKTFVKKIAGE